MTNTDMANAGRCKLLFNVLALIFEACAIHDDTYLGGRPSLSSP
jgi:hypothetical protein